MGTSTIWKENLAVKSMDIKQVGKFLDSLHMHKLIKESFTILSPSFKCLSVIILNAYHMLSSASGRFRLVNKETSHLCY